MREKTIIENETLSPKRRKPMMFIFIVLLFFIFYKFSLLNYFGIVTFSDAKEIIKDFEKNYLYSDVIMNQEYIKMKNSLLSHLFTSKSKLEKLIDYSKQLTEDNATHFCYADIMQGKVNYSLYKKMELQSKKIDSNSYYIKLSSFGENAEKKFFKALEKAKDIKYLIMDLRGNEMGFYTEAVGIADDLLPGNLDIASVEFSNSKHDYSSNALFFDFKKIYVLLDEESACCSELLALALKENLDDKVELVGKKTKGMDIGQIYKTYYNKINFSIAAYKWNVKSKASESLVKYLSPYEDISLNSLDDYMKVVEYLK